MLAIARALVRGPALLLLDEPSLGLAPVMVKVIYQTIRRIRDLGVTFSSPNRALEGCEPRFGSRDGSSGVSGRRQCAGARSRN